MNVSSPRRILQGCIAFFLPSLLALCAVALSAKRQYPADPTCAGMLGAGFPALFICDDWGGGSPTGSWNKIDFVDVLNGGVKPASFLLDLLFYTVLIWGALFLAAALLRRASVLRGSYSWAAWVSIGYILGLLTGYLIFHPNALGLERLPVRTPTPVMPTAVGFTPTRPPPNATLLIVDYSAEFSLSHLGDRGAPRRGGRGVDLRKSAPHPP